MADLLHEPSSGATERLAALQALTAQLARLTTGGEVASFVLEECSVRVGATTGSLCLVEGDHLGVVAAVGYAPEVELAWREFPLSADYPVGQCVLERRPVYCESEDELLERWPRFRWAPLAGDRSFAVLPLQTATDSVLGALVLGYAEARRFSFEDRGFLEALAREAAAAFDRARTREALVAARAASEAANAQLAFLAEASGRLAASLDLDETLSCVAQLAVPRLADRCVLYLAERDGSVSKLPLAVFDKDGRAALAFREVTTRDRSGPGAVIRTGRAVHATLVGEESIEAIDPPEQRSLVRRAGLGGVFIVPLQARGERIGALAFANRSARIFTSDDRVLAEELAARAAVAIDNARLFGRELRIAETLQHALLPDRLPEPEGLELAATYAAGAAGVDVGGDWYDVMELGGRRLALVVGDVSGRGVSAARVMASLRHAVRAYALEGHRPGSILGWLNGLLDISRDGHFATVLCGLLDAGDGTLELASAGHLDALIVGAKGARSAGAPVGPPIGVSPAGGYRTSETELGVGEALLAFTDGLVERRDATLDKGLDRLAGAATRRSLLALPDLLAGVMAELTPGAPEDDTAVLAIRRVAGR